MPNNKEVCTIREGGRGSEAVVYIQLRRRFPGLGGEIQTRQPIITALREELNTLPGGGHNLFLRHLLFKKLDDFFCRAGAYSFPHIARPLGSISMASAGQDGEGGEEAYMYEWVHGTGTFPWEYADIAGSGYQRIILEEWNTFICSFAEAGVDFSRDVSDADNGRISQNIVHEFCVEQDLCLNVLWKRIDFGFRSVQMDYCAYARFLAKNADDLIMMLGLDRFELMRIASAYLVHSGDITEREKGKLEILAREYRCATMAHHLATAIHPLDIRRGLKVSSGAETLQ